LSDDDIEDARRAWMEGPDEEAESESWLLLGDDELLHQIETLAADADDEDERLLEVVASARHFFIRQEAAKRVRDRDRLFDFEDDRHVGQILVRHLTRREDVTYLQQLAKRSRHVEVRSAAQVQLARLWRRLEAPLVAHAPATPAPSKPSLLPLAEARAVAADVAPPPASAASRAAEPEESGLATPAEPMTSAALEKGGVDGSLLAWAVHFLVEPTWSDVGTERTRELLTQTRRELLGRHPTLVVFSIAADARVTINLDAGPRLPSDCVRALAAWMLAYRAAARELAPEATRTSVRAATAMVADALRDVGFYTACDEIEGGRA